MIVMCWCTVDFIFFTGDRLGTPQNSNFDDCSNIMVTANQAKIATAVQEDHIYFLADTTYPSRKKER